MKIWIKVQLVVAFCLSVVVNAGDLAFDLHPTNQGAVAGETVTFSAHANSALAVSYQWYKNNFPIPGETASTLVFRVIDSQDEGAYKVQAKTTAESLFSNEALLKFLTVPVVTITAPSGGAQLGAGEPHHLAAEISGTTSIVTNVSFFNGELLLGSDDNAPFEISPLLPIGAYTLKAIALTSDGTSGTSGPVSFTVVQKLPTISLQPFSQRVQLGRTVDFRAAAVGPDPLRYKWTHNGVLIPAATSPTLTMIVTNVDQAGEYRFGASNDDGSAESEPAQLEIKAAGPNFQSRFKHAIPTFPVDQLLSMAFGNGILMAVGPRGLVLVSNDGIDWWEASPPYTDNFTRVRFLNGKFWALSDRGFIISSADAVNWERVSGNTGSNALRDITYLDGLYVAVGEGGRITRSTDGVVWTPQIIDARLKFISVAAGNGTFIALNGPTADNAYVSTNGSVWQEFQVEALGQESHEIFFFNGHFVAARPTGVFTSDDGKVWVKRLAGGGIFGYRFGIQSPSRLMLFGIDRKIARSDNGIDFVVDPALSPGGPTAGAYSGVYHLIGNSTYFAGSINGLSWSILNDGSIAAGVPHVTFGGGKFFITGAGTDVRVSDGVASWTNRATFQSVTADPSPTFSSVAFGGGKYVATVSNRATEWISDDGTTFSRVDGANRISEAQFMENEFLGVYQSTALRSSDGTTWSSQALGGGTVYDVAKGGNRAIAVGVNGTVFVSENGHPWELVPPPTPKILQGATYADGKFVVVGKDGFVMYSPDGRQWFEGRRTFSLEVTDVAYGQGMFVATANAGSVLYSWDGINWESEQLHTTPDLFSIAYGNGRWVIGGRGGLLLQTAAAAIGTDFQIHATLAGNQLKLQVSGEPGALVHLQRSPTLSPPAWTTIESFSLGDTPSERTFDPAGEMAFFQIVSE